MKIKSGLECEARGKPSTWLPRGGLVEQIFIFQSRWKKNTKWLKKLKSFQNNEFYQYLNMSEGSVA